MAKLVVERLHLQRRQPRGLLRGDSRLAPRRRRKVGDERHHRQLHSRLCACACACAGRTLPRSHRSASAARPRRCGARPRAPPPLRLRHGRLKAAVVLVRALAAAHDVVRRAAKLVAPRKEVHVDDAQLALHIVHEAEADERGARRRRRAAQPAGKRARRARARARN